MKNLIILIISFVFLSEISGQSSDNVTFQSNIKDKQTGQPLAYATVFNIETKNGTAADLNGTFTLPNNTIGDSVKISYIGYEDFIIVINQKPPVEIFLTQKTNLIDEIVIRSEDEYLYRLVSNLKKNKSTDLINSKTYLFLETKSENKTIELLEGYYNGKFQDGVCSKLDLKKGRIGLKPINDRYFMSTESSKLFNLHDHFKQHKVLPHNPLALKKRKLRKQYTLTLIGVFEEDGKRFYDISFEPKKDKASYFSGHVIFDIDENTIKQIEFEIKDSGVHPFIPFGGISIGKVNMKINKTFYTQNGKSFVDGINFNYQLTYSDRDLNKVNVDTEVFIKTYNQPEKFNLPLYNFPNCNHKDYRDITLGNYDSIYWQKNTEFRFYEKKDFINDFVQENFIENNFVIAGKSTGQMEFNYELWNQKRILLKETPKKNDRLSKISNFRRSRVNSINDKFNFNVKLFLNITEIGGQYTYEIYSTIDPVNTYYYSTIEDIDHAFINMYFDLMEIEKRALEEKLKTINLSNHKLVTKLYKEAIANFDNSSTQFCRDVDQGQDFEQLSKWNDLISHSIQIDNLKVFGFKATTH